ncbi:MAG: Glu/Leu/Phe/Val dehydrogenase dimerization domain-containing protein [Actinomycetota bacterium]
MDLLDTSGPVDHEQVVFCQDRSSGLRAIIAIHSTRLGPSLGGTRFYPYATEADALADVLLLARAMTYKSAAAGLDLGGGKAVIIGDPKKDKTGSLFRTYARYVDSLGGRYITTEDVGTTVDDMNVIHTVTKHVTGFARADGGSGDPSEATGWGAFSAIRAVARRLWGSDFLTGRHIAIQGVGKVGSHLAGHLAGAGARLTIADVSPEAAERIRDRHGASVVAPDAIHRVEADIYSPCALGGALSPQTIPEIASPAVAGCANNQLATPDSAQLMADRSILYAPDYIVNAGGVINISYEQAPGGYDHDRAFAHCARIGETLERVFDVASEQNITTAAAADHLAESRLDAPRE